MGLKKEDITNPKSCLNKAADDEPIFVLRAQDRTAPRLVRVWALNSGLPPGNPKREEAMRLARQMDEWQKNNKVKNPD